MNYWQFWHWFAHPVDDFGNESGDYYGTHDLRLYQLSPVAYWRMYP